MVQWIYTGGAGLLGRLVFHAKLVQAGRRKAFTWALMWDVPIALGMGWGALGLASWLKLPWETTISLSLVVAYLGPYGIDKLFLVWAESKIREGGK